MKLLELARNIEFIKKAIRDVAIKNREGVFAQIIKERSDLEPLVKRFRKEIEDEFQSYL